jgi:hypothetical protein
MTVRKLDPITGDIVTSGVQFLTERDEVAQTIKTRLALFLGEYFRDINDGTPWFQEILGKGGTLSSKDAIIKRRIAQTPDVKQILEFNTEFDIPTRTYTVTGQVLTTYGEVDFAVGKVV